MSAQPSAAGGDATALAEELDAIRRRVLNVVGHELRTPVTMLHGLAIQACSATDLQEVTATIGPALLRGAERLTALLDDLLVAAGIQTAIPVGAPTTVDLVDLVQGVWADLSPEALDVAGEVVEVHAPRGLLQEAVEAVLGNAVAYGTGPPHVAIAAEDGLAVITVDSPGPPLHPEEVSLATEAFFRGERAVTTRPGLGVGLAIARALTRHLGGDLQLAASEIGTVTTITVPRQAAA